LFLETGKQAGGGSKMIVIFFTITFPEDMHL